MTPPLPLPVRVAAGLLVTAVEQVRGLPRLALELPVTAVSQALQASMRVQQKVTELAIKGDRVLGAGTPVEDDPPWATFDDDPAPAARPGRRNGRGAAEAAADRATVTALRRTPDRPAQTAPPADPGPVDPGSVDPGSVDPGSVDPAPVPGGPRDTPPTVTPSGDSPPIVITSADTPPVVTPPAATSPIVIPSADALPAGTPPPDALPAGTPAHEALPAPGADTTGDDGPAVLPGYAELTIPQLRGKLRHLGLSDLRTLLEWEHAHGDRPPYVTMLSNRIATLSEQ